MARRLLPSLSDHEIMAGLMTGISLGEPKVMREWEAANASHMQRMTLANVWLWAQTRTYGEGISACKSAGEEGGGLGIGALCSA